MKAVPAPSRNCYVEMPHAKYAETHEQAERMLQKW
jgi:hypothetical protein